MIEGFKPMLICNDEVDLSKIKFPFLASGKLDGVRGIVTDDGKLLSRSFKEIPNKQIQKKFQNLKDYCKKNKVTLDGELYGNGMTFQEITHFVMTQDLDEEGETLDKRINFFAFDCITGSLEMPFEERYSKLQSIKEDNLVIVKQQKVNSKSEVEALFEEKLAEGKEGLVLKKASSKYKFGRTTFNSGDCYKVKPFMTFDSKIIRIEERMENTSESFKNELGKSEKHSFKSSMVPTGIAATLVVMFNGMEQKVCLTGTEDFRREIWNNQNKYIGQMIEFKGMLLGSKDLVRHPTFVRFRMDK